MRQLRYPPDVIDAAIRINKGGLGKFLAGLLAPLAASLECEVSGLRLDHNPALGLRKKIMGLVNGERVIVGYIPHEHSVADLEYRSDHGHHIKTNVRGDGAQYSDTVLMKRERRRQKREAGSSRKKKGSKFQIAQNRKEGVQPFKRGVGFGSKSKAWPKGRKIESRGFEKRNRP